jgi:hypothetical protein
MQGAVEDTARRRGLLSRGARRTVEIVTATSIEEDHMGSPRPHPHRRFPPTLIPAVLLLGLVQGLIVLAPTPAVAGPDEATDIVAPYVHLPVAIAPATGPLSTVFMVRASKVASVQVFVKCFNDASQFVGPPVAGAPGPFALNITQYQTFVFTPDGSGPSNISAHPLFTGIGWCYFSSADKFSVEVAWGLYGGPRGTIGFDGLPDHSEMRMFSSNASVGVAVAVGQAMVSGGSPAVAGPPISGVGNVPLWVTGNWVDALVLVNPTAVGGQVTVDLSVCATCSFNPPTASLVVPLPARGMGIVMLSNFYTGTFPHGNATIRSGLTCCFVGWHWALNPTTHQALFREVSLDRDTTRFLAGTDRP